MNRMVNYFRLLWKLAFMLRTYRTCYSMVGFSKYEFNYKLLGGVTLLRVTLDVTWTQLIYIYIYDKISTYDVRFMIIAFYY